MVAVTKADVAVSRRAKSNVVAFSESPSAQRSAFLSSAPALTLQTQLAEQGLVSEALGGEVQLAVVNAKGFLSEVERQGLNRDASASSRLRELATEFGLSDLVERVALQTALLELGAAPEGKARAFTLETSLSPTEGGSASIIILDGSLRVGDWVVCGNSFCKVRSMQSSATRSNKVSKATINCAGPGEAVDLFGFSSSRLPPVGETLEAVKDEDEARRRAEVSPAHFLSSSLFRFFLSFSLFENSTLKRDLAAPVYGFLSLSLPDV